MSKGEESKKSELAQKEEEILEYWKDKEIFKKSLKQREGKEEFVFYEGPPTANGRPGIHHLEARAFKDAIPRFKTMQGYHVRRKGGWDTHGLPVELEVEKELGISSKPEIEQFGIAKFNEKCKENVWKYVDEWARFTERIGYWVDLDNAYITYRPQYIETLWWILKQVEETGLLYKDYRVVPWCPRCGTALSSHELAQGYEDVKDLSVTVKFELVDEPGTYVLAWTTTPWTLPGNVALAVGGKLQYIEVETSEGEHLILAKEREKQVLKDSQYKVVREMPGSELVGREYKPLYPFTKEIGGGVEGMENAYKVYAADFVTTEDGTGIVHTAVMYGQDDFELGSKMGLPKVHLVDETGHFIQGTGFLEGTFVKSADTDVSIIKDLAHRGLLFAKEKYEHSYPHCWRCKTPLIYYARDSWYIRMSSLREELIEENKDINWEPAHIKDGRFGEWLDNIRDWAISRERYWGTPLPVWVNKKGDKRVVIGSLDELGSKTKSTNSYTVMRHGEAENNIKGILNSSNVVSYSLTEQGKKDVMEAAKALKESVDIIYHSPLTRARETAEVIARELGIPNDSVLEDDRLREYNFGDLDGKQIEDYWEFRKDQGNYYEMPTPGGESFIDVKKRIGDFLYDIDQKYEGKKILIVGHGATLEVVPAVVEGADVERSFEIMRKYQEHKPAPGHHEAFTFARMPHNERYELDLHRPYIDDITWKEDGEVYKRVSEVMDVWFDSGAMPFAQDHYPFENKEWVDEKGFPADYISEAIDQTRGWFYTLHAVGALLGKGKAYKNIICLGHILDAEGKKMSKSKGNTVNPWDMADKYGVDVLRFWMYSVNQPGESKNFDEKTVDEVQKKVFNLLLNSVKFYEMYAGEGSGKNPLESSNVLDTWVLAMMAGLVKEVTENLENYKLLEATRAIRDFIADFSQWYIRRSRDRFKDLAQEDGQYAVAVMAYVLRAISILLAPFAPFTAEDIYGRVGGEKESVHLEDWPNVNENLKAKNENLIDEMRVVRDIVSRGLKLRSEAGINARQPLASLEVKNQNEKVKSSDQLVSLICDEVNVKEVRFGVAEDALDTTITPELKREGDIREIIRAIQSLRKKEGLEPSDKVVLLVDTNEDGQALIASALDEIKQTTNLSDIEFAGAGDGEELVLDELKFAFKVKK